MNTEKYDEITDKLSNQLFESYTDSMSTKKKEGQTVEIVKNVFIEELQKRNIRYDKEVVDIYPHCLKVDKETMEYPLYREAIEATRKKVKDDFGIDLELYAF